ncbi:transporter substrate-binding domain-containing protein [Aliidiomarina sp. Khilg15.8]
MKSCVFSILLTLICSTAAYSQSTDSVNATSSSEPLQVAVRTGAPFVIETDSGYTGITIELWERIADDIGVEFEYQPQSLDGLLQGMADEQFDIGLGPLTVTAERERFLDFSQPFHNAGLAIAVRRQDSPGWWAATQRFFTLEFASVMLALIGILTLSGFLLWLFERGHNREEFSDERIRGIGAGFWWAAVTMTTVGYGDKSPRTTGGRVIALIWMFTSVIIISSFTASIASSLTVNQLASNISGPGDLDSVRVGTLPNSYTANYLDNRYIAHQEFVSLNQALERLAANEIDAVVYDAPLLRYQMRRRFGGELMLLPNTFMQQNYALTLTEGSALREPVNRALLDFTSSPDWQRLLESYLGE